MRTRVYPFNDTQRAIGVLTLIAFAMMAGHVAICVFLVRMIHTITSWTAAQLQVAETIKLAAEQQQLLRATIEARSVYMQMQACPACGADFSENVLRTMRERVQ